MKTQSESTVIALDQLTAAQQSTAGGKAFNCARLKQAGFRVPEGLVVLSTATAADFAGIADHPWFDGLPADSLFAVRSSGIGEDGVEESFAGIHQTLLNVQRSGLAAAIESCRASGRSAQALEYRLARKMSTDDIAMGVLIQRMVRPVAAGVAFTVNPLTGADELVMRRPPIRRGRRCLRWPPASSWRSAACFPMHRRSRASMGCRRSRT